MATLANPRQGQDTENCGEVKLLARLGGARPPINKLLSMAIDTAIRVIVLPVEPEVL